MKGIFWFAEAVKQDPTIDVWLNEQAPPLGVLARTWFQRMRECGRDVRELMHDGCPTACVEGAAFGYVNVFRAHANVGFFHGAALEDPTGLLEGTGKRMRHVKVKAGVDLDSTALAALISTAYADMKLRLAAEHGVSSASSRPRAGPRRRQTRGINEAERGSSWPTAGAFRRVLKSSTMSFPEEHMDHTATMRRLYDLINAADIDAFGSHLADDFTEREDLPGPPSKAGVIQYFRMLIAAFPDLRMVAEDVIASGDKAVARVRMTGTHKGPFMGMAATDKQVDVKLIDIIRFGDDGRAREHWGVVDQLTMLQQLGAIPAGPSM